MTDIREHLIHQLEDALGNDQKWIIATEILVGASGTVKWLERLGAQSALVIASARGAGDPPNADFAPTQIVFDLESDDMMSAIHQSSELLANLPQDAWQTVDAYDPDQTCRVLGTIFDDGRPVAGREKFGARPLSWRKLEDKTIIDDLWDAIGVQRSPSVVVETELDALKTAHSELDEGAGTVWAADAKSGFHGGAAYTRWVKTPAQQEEVYEAYKDVSERVRVMPFLEGIVCSIHGFVFAEDVAVLRPCEMLVFRKPNGEFHYGRAATFWDPSDEDRNEMRSIARRVGEYLGANYDYRGAFTVDGVMTKDGFRPTELNPRFGAALGALARSIDLHAPLLNLVLVEEPSRDWRPREFEDLFLTAADSDRSGGTMAIFKKPFDETEKHDLFFDDQTFRFAQEGETPTATLTLGPHAVGGIAFVVFDAESTPIGPSTAPRAAAALAFVDEEFSLGIGPLKPAKDVRV